MTLIQHKKWWNRPCVKNLVWTERWISITTYQKTITLLLVLYLYNKHNIFTHSNKQRKASKIIGNNKNNNNTVVEKSGGESRKLILKWKRVEFSGGLHRLYTQTGHRKSHKNHSDIIMASIASGGSDRISIPQKNEGPPCTKEELDLFLSSAQDFVLSDTFLEVMCSNIDEGLPMQEKAGVLTKRLKEQYNVVWVKCLSQNIDDSGISDPVPEDCLDMAMQHFVGKEKDMGLLERYKQFCQIEKQRLMVALYGREELEKKEKLEEEVQGYAKHIQEEYIKLEAQEIHDKLNAITPAVQEWQERLTCRKVKKTLFFPRQRWMI